MIPPPAPAPSMDGCHDFFVCSSPHPPEEDPPPPQQHHEIDLNLSLGLSSPLPAPEPTVSPENPLLRLPSRDQIWQSLQRNGNPLVSPAQDSIWNRRSASVQVLKDSSFDDAVIRRSSSSGAPLQHRYPPVLRRQLSDLESLMLSSMQKQQEALEVQKRREIQAQRRGKRRSLMDEKLSKKAKLQTSSSSSSCGYQRICNKLPTVHQLVDDGQTAKTPDVDGEISNKVEWRNMLKCDGGSAAARGSSEEDLSTCTMRKSSHFASDLRESAAANDGVKEADCTSTAAMNGLVRCETDFCEDRNIDSCGGTRLSHATIMRTAPRFGAEVEDDAGRHRCATEEPAEGERRNGGEPEKWGCTGVLRRATSSTNHLVSGIRRRRGEEEAERGIGAEEEEEEGLSGGGGKAGSDGRSLKCPAMERQRSWPSAGRWVAGENWGEGNREEAEAMGGGVADLVWVTTTGRGPKGKTISGVMYIIGAAAAAEAAEQRRQEVRLICSCHGKHMTPREFVEHSGSSDLSNPERSIVVNPPPSFRHHLLAAPSQV